MRVPGPAERRGTAARPETVGRRGAAERTAATDGPDAEHETLAQCLRKLVQLLPQVTRGLRRRQLPSGPKDFRLGPRHGVALSVLSEHGPMTIGRLAGELGLTLPTVSGIVADVERAGFVERSADPGDRRRIIVSLATPHAAALDNWLDGATAPMARALHKLSPAERITFLKAMTFLEAELNDAPDVGPPCPSACAGEFPQVSQ